MKCLNIGIIPLWGEEAHWEDQERGVVPCLLCKNKLGPRLFQPLPVHLFMKQKSLLELDPWYCTRLAESRTAAEHTNVELTFNFERICSDKMRNFATSIVLCQWLLLAAGAVIIPSPPENPVMPSGPPRVSFFGYFESKHLKAYQFSSRLQIIWWTIDIIFSVMHQTKALWMARSLLINNWTATSHSTKQRLRITRPFTQEIARRHRLERTGWQTSHLDRWDFNNKHLETSKLNYADA